MLHFARLGHPVLLVEIQHEAVATTPLLDVPVEPLLILLGVFLAVLQELLIFAWQVFDTGFFRLKPTNGNVAGDEADSLLQSRQLALDSLLPIQPFRDYLTSLPLTMAGLHRGGPNSYSLQLEK